jgi:histone-lysine N-methyltransferase SETD3
LTRTDEHTVSGLLHWLAKKGAHLPALAIRHHADGQRSACAHAPIPAGAHILEVPRRLFLSEELAKESELGQRIAEAGVEFLDEQSWLAAFLLQEKHAADSFWAPYLATLPASLHHLPFYLTPEQLTLLQGSSAQRRLELQRRSILLDYELLCQRIPGFERFGLRAFSWARLTVLTRVFRLTIQGKRTRAIVPVADLFDHQRPSEARWTYDDARKSFTLTALQDLKPGDAIHVSYGRKGNTDLFVTYGFCVEENEDDTAEVFVPAVPPEHPLTREAQALLGPDKGFRIPARYDAEETRRLFSFLRLTCAQDGEQPPAVVDPLTPGEVAPVSMRNEAAVLRALATACEEALRRFETTLAQDEELLRAPGLTGTVRTCLLLRRGEKRVLQAWRSLAETALPLLQGAPPAGPPVARAGAGGFARFLAPAAPPRSAPVPLLVSGGRDYLEGVVWELVRERA